MTKICSETDETGKCVLLFIKIYYFIISQLAKHKVRHFTLTHESIFFFDSENSTGSWDVVWESLNHC